MKCGIVYSFNFKYMVAVLGMMFFAVSAFAAETVASSDALERTDPEFAAIFNAFTFDEVVRATPRLDGKTRALVTLASLVAGHATTAYDDALPRALEAGVSPVEIKEVLYQAVPYAGAAKVMDFIKPTNDFLRRQGVSLPLPPQSNTTPETRYDKGLDLQVEIFGEVMRRRAVEAPDNQRHIRTFLSDNCFGDYQTRSGLDVRTRELLTFSILISLGGCEPQVKSHINGNLAVGNDKNMMIAVATALLPYNGYPRTLNAIACLNEIIPENKP